MSTFTVHCKCGERFHADDASVGRRIRCRRCNRIIELRPVDPSLVVASEPDGERQVRRSRRRRSRSTADRAWHHALAWLEGRVRRAEPTPPVRRRARARPGARTVARLAWAYVAAVTLIAVVMWGTGDRWWLGTVLLFMGRWVFLLPLALLVPAVLLVRRGLVPLLLGALVVLGPVMGVHTGWRRALPHADGPRVRVVTLNANRGEEIVPDLPIWLERWKPDVVALQECGESLAEATRHVQGWHHHDAEGLCLLSRFPIRETRVMDRHAFARVREDAAAIGGAAYVVRYALEAPFGTFDFANLHLETPRKGLEALATFELGRLQQNTELRDIESGVARRWVARRETPLLVAGDFNTPVESRIFRLHWGDLADAFSHAGVGLGATRYNGWIRVRIDHVLSDASWRPDRATVGADVGSDHRPLIADLTYVGRRR